MSAIYTSEKTIQEMVFVLSEILEKKILESMREFDHFSILFDETTDYIHSDGTTSGAWMLYT